MKEEEEAKGYEHSGRSWKGRRGSLEGNTKALRKGTAIKRGKRRNAIARV